MFKSPLTFTLYLFIVIAGVIMLILSGFVTLKSNKVENHKVAELIVIDSNKDREPYDPLKKSKKRMNRICSGIFGTGYVYKDLITEKRYYGNYKEGVICMTDYYNNDGNREYKTHIPKNDRERDEISNLFIYGNKEISVKENS